VARYRKVESRNREQYEIILDKTPFYAESGGQVGDSGLLIFGDEKIPVIDTRKENDLIIHVTNKLPADPSITARAQVNASRRIDTINNHSATHLMHRALRQVLGEHVEQKGSLVDENHLRFDFSHFQKMSDEEIRQVEDIVNQDIRKNLKREENRSVPIREALDMGAIAFFGEKYGEDVRVIKFGDSIELCGGTHVPQTGQIGLFKIISEGAIAAGIRRIEAITGNRAQEYVQEQSRMIHAIKEVIKQKDIVKGVENLFNENDRLQKQVKQLLREKAKYIETKLKEQVKKMNGIHFLSVKLDESNALIKDLAFSMIKSDEKLFFLAGNNQEGKAMLTLALGKELIDGFGMDAGKLIRDLAKEINGGGGGQPHFATAGGGNPRGLDAALARAELYVKGL
jgi:alanyl-tRNA synthetase